MLHVQNAISCLNWRLFSLILFVASTVSPLFDDADEDDHHRRSSPLKPESHHHQRHSTQSHSTHDSNDVHNNDNNDASEVFLCKWCGHEVFRSSEGFVRRPSSHSISAFPFSTIDGDGKNVTVRGLRLVNPHRVAFDLITTKTAHTRLHGDPVVEDSWFDGYAWTISVCSHCGKHLGWKFTAVDDAQCPVKRIPAGNDRVKEEEEEEEEAPLVFHGLVVSQLVRENFVANLIKLPKMAGNTRY